MRAAIKRGRLAGGDRVITLSRSTGVRMRGFGRWGFILGNVLIAFGARSIRQLDARGILSRASRAAPPDPLDASDGARRGLARG